MRIEIARPGSDDAAVAAAEDRACASPDRATMTRALRELEAAKLRVERDARAAADELRAGLIRDLLPLLDDLDRTVAAARVGGDAPAVVEGVELVRAQLATVLAGYGVERIDARDRAFDPAVHEAIASTPVADPSAHGVVIDQIAPGYRFAERLLRPARVVVGRYSRT